jgi:hypothetical protein
MSEEKNKKVKAEAEVKKEPQSKPEPKSQPQPSNMEVHKHPHHVTHKKKWGEYLLEFLMLFLAVFLGFIAENIRENGVNREIEKNNIKSFVKNLREDSLRLIHSIDVNEKRFNYLDSLINLKSTHAAETIFQKQFIYYMLKLGYLDYFTSNGSTFKQMQSSGTLRLINHAGVLDSILNYETVNERIKRQEDICSVWWNKAIEQVSSIVDLTPLAQLPPDALWNITQNDLDNIQMPTLSNDLSTLQSYFNWRINERISLGYYIVYLRDQLSGVRMLIPFLQKEYHLR